MASVKFCTVLKEIMPQRLANLKKQVGVNPRSHKQFVKVLTRTVHLQRQPYCRATLPGKLLLDGLPDMETVWCCLAFHTAYFNESSLATKHKKGARRYFMLINAKGSGKPSMIISKTAHAMNVNLSARLFSHR